MKFTIKVDKKTSSIIDIIIQCEEFPDGHSLKEYLLGGDFHLSIGHGAKLSLGLILEREEYEIVEVEHKE